MATATQILGWIKNCFDKREWSYEELEDRPALRSSGFPVKCKFSSVKIIINCNDTSFLIHGYIPLDADEDCRQRVAEYFTRANYGLRYGNFEMDFRDGEMRYKHVVDCEGMTSLSDDVLMSNLSLPLRMIERYGDNLIAVMYGIKTPEEAINDAESDK